MVVGINYGKPSYKNWLMNLVWKYQFVIFHLARASGIKLNIKCFHIFQ